MRKLFRSVICYVSQRHAVYLRSPCEVRSKQVNFRGGWSFDVLLALATLSLSTPLFAAAQLDEVAITPEAVPEAGVLGLRLRLALNFELASSGVERPRPVISEHAPRAAEHLLHNAKFILRGEEMLSSRRSEGQRLMLALPAGSLWDQAPAEGMARESRYDLDQIVAVAVLGHPSVAAKRIELDAARSDVDAARWRFFPSPSVSAQLAGKSAGDATVLSLQQPLWTAGRLTAGLDAANSRVGAADVAISEAQYALALRVAAAYRGWQSARGRSKAFAKGVALLDSYVEMMRRRIEGGVSANVDLELVISRISQMRSDLASASAFERIAVSQLSQMAGMTLMPENLVVSPAASESIPRLDALLAAAIERNPTLRRIEHEVEAARHESVQKRASLWPALNLRAEHQAVRSALDSSRTADSRVMLVFEYAPGAGLSGSAEANAAEARVAGLRESRDAIRRELIEKISTDYEELLASVAQKTNLWRTLKAAREVLASYERLFVAGKRSWLDVLNAARELTQAEVMLVEVEAALTSSRYRLRLYGGNEPWLQGNNL